jgi:hypothetical protein
MSSLDDAKDFVAKHDKQLDDAMGKAGESIDERTGQGHSGEVEQGVDFAQKHTGDDDSATPEARDL